jgi:hypothetical protein
VVAVVGHAPETPSPYVGSTGVTVFSDTTHALSPPISRLAKRMPGTMLVWLSGHVRTYARHAPTSSAFRRERELIDSPLG